MTIQTQILLDLLAGQSTADSIAGRVKADTPAVEVILKRLEREQLVDSGLILGTLRVWHLTTEGRIQAQQTKPAPRVLDRQTPPATPA